MVRSELVALLAKENPELSAQEIEKIVDLFFEAIVDQLAAGGRVELRGFGAFSTRLHAARTGRNPRSGAAVPVPAKRSVHFKPGKAMREGLIAAAAGMTKAVPSSAAASSTASAEARAA
jgi:integration host factor subunit beta